MAYKIHTNLQKNVTTIVDDEEVINTIDVDPFDFNGITIDNEGVWLVDNDIIENDSDFGIIWEKIREGDCFVSYNDVEVENSLMKVSELYSLRNKDIESYQAISFRLWDLLSKEVQKKSISSVNYITELTNGYYLHKDHDIHGDGLIDKTTYYYGYVNQEDKGVPFIEVNQTFTLLPDSPHRSQQSVDKNQIDWYFYKRDGSKVMLKSKTKIYDDHLKRNAEGVRRRGNITGQLNTSLITSILFTAAAPDVPTAVNMVVSLLGKFSDELDIWKQSGGGGIFDAISDIDVLLNPDYAWLDNIVPDLHQTQATVPQWIGNSIRNNIISKLKGEFV